jgi:hypothetical protein
MEDVPNDGGDESNLNTYNRDEIHAGVVDADVGEEVHDVDGWWVMQPR